MTSADIARSTLSEISLDASDITRRLATRDARRHAPGKDGLAAPASIRGLRAAAPERPKAERVSDDRDARERHRQARQDRGEQPAGHRVEQTRRDRNADHVVEEGPEQVLANGL